MNWTIEESSTRLFYEDHGCGSCGDKTPGLIAVGIKYGINKDDDIVKCFCRKCSKNNKAWERHEQDIEIRKKEVSKQLESSKSEARRLIALANDITISEDDGETIITINV